MAIPMPQRKNPQQEQFARAISSRIAGGQIKDKGPPTVRSWYLSISMAHTNRFYPFRSLLICENSEVLYRPSYTLKMSRLSHARYRSVIMCLARICALNVNPYQILFHPSLQDDCKCYCGWIRKGTKCLTKAY